jgi:putative peptidoglycan lipid II flippase
MSRSLVRNTGILAFFTSISRVLGLVRDQVFLALFGAGGSLLTDAYLAAFRIPNLFRDLFAEGALSAAFVTTFSSTLEKEGDHEAWALANRVVTALTLVVGTLVVVGVVAAPLWVRLIAPGFADIPGKTELTVRLTRILWPFLLFVALAAVWMGMLNARGKFAVPASASTVFNAASLLVGVPVAFALDSSWGAGAMVGMCFGTLAGGLFQWCVQMPSLRKEGYRFRPRFDFGDPGFRRVVRLMTPALVGTAAVQVNVTVNTIFATMIPGNGPVSWLNASFRLMQLPIGIFGVAVATATLPTLSRAAAREDMDDFRRTLSKALRLVALLCVPSACGLAILAEPIIGALYQHGRFTAEDTFQTAWALRYYALGLAGYAAIKVLAPASYALGDARTPALVSLGSILVNLAMNWLFTLRLGWGHRGLAFAVSTVATVNFVLLLLSIRRHVGRLASRSLDGVLRIGAASATMSVVCWVTLRLMTTTLGVSFPGRVVTTLACVGVSGVAFWFGARLLRVEEVGEVVDAVRRRLGSRSHGD